MHKRRAERFLCIINKKKKNVVHFVNCALLLFVIQ